MRWLPVLGTGQPFHGCRAFQTGIVTVRA